MTDCLMCQQTITFQLPLKEIFQFKAIFPPRLCGACRAKFQLNQKVSPRCTICDHGKREGVCADCRRWQRVYHGKLLQHESLFSYNEGMETWFKHYKFLGDYRLRETFSAELAHYLWPWRDWLLVPIPLSHEGLKKRGFNQVEALLLSAGQRFYPVLEKVGETAPQTSKSQQERLASPQRFRLKNEGGHFLQGKKILLVDDVYTTGRTLYHARDCLQDVKALTIRSFSLAR